MGAVARAPLAPLRSRRASHRPPARGVAHADARRASRRRAGARAFGVVLAYVLHASLPAAAGNPAAHRRDQSRCVAPNRHLARRRRQSAGIETGRGGRGAHCVAARNARARARTFRHRASGFPVALQVLAGRAHGRADRPRRCGRLAGGADRRPGPGGGGAGRRHPRTMRRRIPSTCRGNSRCPSSPR